MTRETSAPAESQRGASFVVGDDRLRLLDTGPERLDALVQLIDEARTSLRLLYYIYATDDAGRRVRDAVLGAARRGVAVSMIVDGFGSDADDAFFAPIEQAGVSVCRFLPRWGRRYLLRNHQKLALADEGRAIIGGFNISSDYFATEEAGGWRDLGLLVEGPAAGRLAGYFDALAAWTHEDRATIRKLRRLLRDYSETSGSVRWLLGGPTRRLSPWARSLKRDLRASASCHMLAGYFAPNPAMLRAIERIGRAGNAQVIVPAKTDHNAAIAAARHTYTRLLRRGVRVFEYQPTKLHTKLFVTDSAVNLGSANFDMRSLFLNLEIMLRIEDRAFADHVRGYFAGERAASREVTQEEHAKAATLWQRAQWSAAYFLLAVVDANVTRRLNFGIDGR